MAILEEFWNFAKISLNQNILNETNILTEYHQYNVKPEDVKLDGYVYTCWGAPRAFSQPQKMKYHNILVKQSFVHFKIFDFDTSIFWGFWHLSGIY